MTVEATPAATLIVMREQEGAPPLLLMTTRAKDLAFAGGAIVWPGGRVDPADVAAAEKLGPNLDHGGARIAAIRETIEETAFPVALSLSPDADTAASLQQAILGGSEFASTLDRLGLTADPASLVPFARWKPAFKHARVFDTIFFLAQAPEGNWPLIPQEGECDAAEWVSAADVLLRLDAGDATAIFPTKRNLERLAQFSSFADAIADANAHPLETITPWVETREGEERVCIPEGLGYPVTSEPLATAFRA